MLDRARERGEPAPQHTDILDGILAPIYLRTLLNIGGLDEARLAAFVDRTLSCSPEPAAPAHGG